MNLTLQFTLPLVLFLFSLISPSSSRKNRAISRRRGLAQLKGELFADAAHYFPLNGTSADKKLVDMRGNASAKALNGVQATATEQLATVLKMDGKDDFIEITGFNNSCVVNPTMCTEGLTVAFWIRYYGGEFIISSGDYTKGDHGPGFRFICENCGQKKHPHAHNTQRFLLELSTEKAKWKILLESIPSWWFHFAFTWNGNQGLKFYENGKLALSKNDPVSTVRGLTDPKNAAITIGRANSIFGLSKFGAFSIGHLVIWTYALLPVDVEVAFLLVQDKTAKSIKCCSQMKADPCIKNPCHNGATCHRIEDKYKCICPDASRPSHCFPEHKLPQPCRDKSPQCLELTRQTGYCDYRKKRMRALCPEACNFCASKKGNNTPATPNTSMLNSSGGNSNVTPQSSGEVVPTTVVVGRSVDEEKQGLPKGTMILIVCAGGAGLILLLIVLVFVITRFVKQRKGEFLPDKIHNNWHDKENGDASMEDVQNLPSIIDPSTPRITDVPHKPTRSQASVRGGGRGTKKAKKPMGVQVTYKPPEWD